MATTPYYYTRMLVQRRVFLSGSKRLKRAATVVLRVGTKNMSATADVYVYNSVECI